MTTDLDRKIQSYKFAEEQLFSVFINTKTEANYQAWSNASIRLEEVRKANQCNKHLEGFSRAMYDIEDDDDFDVLED